MKDLPRACSAARGFQNLAPSQGRVPLPFPCFAVQYLVNAGVPMVGLWLLLTWAVCARPGQCLKLLWKHLLPPNPLQDQWTVILSGSDALGRARPSKVGEVDEALMIDQPYLQWLAPVLKKKQRDQKMTDHIFRFDMTEGSNLSGSTRQCQRSS